MRRFFKRGLPVVLFVAIALLYPLLAPPPHRIDEAHFEQIRDGMTLDEVESIFGAPAGNYDWAVSNGDSLWIVSGTGPGTRLFKYGSKSIESLSANGVLWEASDGIVTKTHAGATMVWSVVLNPDFRLHPSKTWTSRHGHCTIWFDPEQRVTTKSNWGSSRIEPPWHNWRRWFSK